MGELSILAQSLDQSRVVQVVREDVEPNRVRIVHRVLKGCLSKWLIAVETTMLKTVGFDFHVSKQYFIRDGRLYYGWNFMAQWQDGDATQRLAQLAEAIRYAMGGATQALSERVANKLSGSLSSYPLVGVGDDRNCPGGPFNLQAPGPDRGGYRHKGAFLGLLKGV